jgi:amidase
MPLRGDDKLKGGPLVDELASLDATAQAGLVRRGEVTPLELVEAAIARIERWDPRLNAVVTPLFDQARDAASGQLPEGPFTGVPFLLKDLGARLGGVRMACGSAFLREYVPEQDSELVVRLKRAGLIMLGKTSTPELGQSPTTEPALFGACHNPWDLGRTPGGSSGGSAAAVAAGLVPMAHANDGGGSIRIPASCCGLFGLKPTRARNPLGPDYGDIGWSLAVEHAVTRSVRDSAALLDATAGRRDGSLAAPYWAPAPIRPFLQEVGTDPGRLRIAFTTTAPSGVPIHPDCVTAVHEAAALCEELRHEVVEASPPLNGPAWAEEFTVLWSANCAASVAYWGDLTRRAPTADEFEPYTWALQEKGRQHTAMECVRAQQRLQTWSLDVARFFQSHDLWLTPTVAEPPPPLGTFDALPHDRLRPFHRGMEFVPFTPICNVTGQPAMSIPLFWNDAGLPVGTHFIARYGDEATLFRLAAQLEAARPWAHRRPVLSG